MIDSDVKKSIENAVADNKQPPSLAVAILSLMESIAGGQVQLDDYNDINRRLDIIYGLVSVDKASLPDE